MGVDNIGDYIGYDGDFKCAFWTTYSIDFSTAYFIVNQHIRPLVDGQPCHIMMDLRRAHEACQEDSDLKALGKLQSRAVISTYDRKVAFHPKLLFLVGDSQIRLLVMSGNATPSGVLSEADLITRFDYDKEDSPHKEIQGIIAEAFRFLKSTPGWHPDALELFEKAQVRHPWLTELKTEIFLGTHKGVSLFEQMVKSLGKSKVTKIEIFSPFYDPGLSALKRFRESFPRVPIEAWVGTGFIELKESLDLNNINKLGISLHRPLFRGRDSFHAKVYRFLLEGTSVIFWGSANCSYSALLSIENNSEVLVKSAVSEDEFRELFDPLPPKPISEAQVRPPSKKDEKIESLRFKIISATIDGGYLSFTVSDIGDFYVKVLGSNGREIASKVLSAKLEANTLKVDIAQIGFKVLAIELVNRSGVVSNRFPLSNLDQIVSSSDVDVPAIRQEVEEDNPEVIHRIERQFFIFERDGTATRSASGSGQSAERDFWRSPRSSRSTIWGAGYPLLSYATQSRLAEAEVSIEEGDDSKKRSPPQKGDKKTAKEGLVFSGWPWAADLGKVVARSYKKLLKFVEAGIKPNEDSWANGLEHFAKHLIKPLVEYKANLDEDLVDNFADILLYVSQMVAYFTNNRKFTDEELKKEIVIARLAAFAKVIDFCYFFSITDIEIYREFHSYLELRENFPKSIQRETRAGFLKTWIYSSFPSLNDTFEEQNLIDIEEACQCIIRTRTAEIAFKNTQGFRGSIAPFPIRNADEGLVFNHPKYGPMLIEQWLGNKVYCRSLLGEIKKLAI